MLKAWGSKDILLPLPCLRQGDISVCPSRHRVMLWLELFCSQTKAGAWTRCSKAQISGDDKKRQKENPEPHLLHPSVLSEAKPVPEQHFFLLRKHKSPPIEPSFPPQVEQYSLIFQVLLLHLFLVGQTKFKFVCKGYFDAKQRAQLVLRGAIATSPARVSAGAHATMQRPGRLTAPTRRPIGFSKNLAFTRCSPSALHQRSQVSARADPPAQEHPWAGA